MFPASVCGISPSRCSSARQHLPSRLYRPRTSANCSPSAPLSSASSAVCPELNPKYAIAFNNRGIAYRTKGQYDRAIQDHDRAIELNPNYAGAFFNRGLAYRDKAQWDFDSYLNEGRYEDLAIRDYGDAIRLNPKNAAAFNNQGNAYVSRRQYDRAIKDYDEAIRLDPNDGLYFGNRGDAFRITGQYERAIADYRKALSLKIDEARKKQIETALKELGVAR
jgi:tetratricopeptide (TPR) repeat protein